METIQVNTSQHVDIDYPLAGLGERIAARLVDLAIFFGLAILFFFFGSISGITSTSAILYTLMILYSAGYIFYTLVCEIFMNGQTLGKRVMKIRVISLDGSQPTIGQYFIRWVFRLVDFVLTGQVLGLILIAITDKKQRIGDIVAGTTVIKTVPHTSFDHIAFQPVEEAYTPVFSNIEQLTDRDVELIHEVISTYYKTLNPDLIYSMASRVGKHLSITPPPEMNQLDFLTTVVKDYKHLTSQVD
ncbi:RDD family protein [Pedobacter nutrimenti]|uniref:RDD family protein n=1 Tax=Pedobacter nutrimenti TaxID=1241337 RepID=UPI00292FEE06|nr:RDD family protein [Pedobacter nutrimenti]